LIDLVKIILGHCQILRKPIIKDAHFDHLSEQTGRWQISEDFLRRGPEPSGAHKKTPSKSGFLFLSLGSGLDSATDHQKILIG
jgi:hypothetical protein